MRESWESNRKWESLGFICVFCLLGVKSLGRLERVFMGFLVLGCVFC